VDEFATSVDAVSTKLDETLAALGAAKTTGTELADTLDNAGIESRAIQACAVVTDIDDEPGAAALKTRIAAIRSAVEALRGLLATVTRTSPAPPSERATFNPRRYLDDMPTMTPRAKRKLGEPVPKTHGRWVDGEEGLTDWISGEGDEHADNAKRTWSEKVDPERRTPLPLVLSHVEMKFAGFMRRTRRQHETLVINHPDGPCKGAYACETLIEPMLAPGSKLTVHWPGDNRRTFTGRQQ
ncbi:MAG: DddA-like double-stranded DNA deaminase toxin, partial [Stackebrandtia sp.]